ncbi:transmembrane protein 59-like isoform X2 [Physella acuta]|uniref:transmembrane protein 59-like isoform X2 n=1 Tax=Physella acuta TaxID=109671 RepID=UPI0027DDE572|nr:transmembrane protein 59-like isoform X2 [Physella acuta]
MVTLQNKLLLCTSIFTFVSITASASLLNLISDIDPCEDACQKTYPSHTYDKSQSIECCKRGCRLYSIIELVGEEDSINGTLKSCFDNCNDAYPGDTDETSACSLGCSSQKPFTDKWGHLVDMDSDFMHEGMPRMMYPFLYMHNMYSNMVDKVTHHMSVSWSFFMQDGSGRLVVIKSQPQVLDMDVQDFDDYSAFKGTSSMIETNIEASDNTATEVLRHSQMKSARGFTDELNAAEAEPWKLNDNSSDWLTCIARKTGIPRLILCMIILFSAIAMIWLCMSAAVTAPEQRFPQKLSISGDLEYLRYLPDKKGIKGIHPQDFIEARPLPVKIHVEKI